jgi:hypothetical protein
MSGLQTPGAGPPLAPGVRSVRKRGPNLKSPRIHLVAITSIHLASFPVCQAETRSVEQFSVAEFSGQERRSVKARQGPDALRPLAG